MLIPIPLLLHPFRILVYPQHLSGLDMALPVLLVVLLGLGEIPMLTSSRSSVLPLYQTRRVAVVSMVACGIRTYCRDCALTSRNLLPPAFRIFRISLISKLRQLWPRKQLQLQLPSRSPIP